MSNMRLFYIYQTYYYTQGIQRVTQKPLKNMTRFYDSLGHDEDFYK